MAYPSIRLGNADWLVILAILGLGLGLGLVLVLVQAQLLMNPWLLKTSLSEPSLGALHGASDERARL